VTIDPCVLAIDLGTSGAKVGLVTADGRVIGSEFAPVELQLRPGGGAEQRPHDWWTATTSAARRLLAGRPAERDAVCAIGLTAQWAGTVAVDGRGEPLCPAIIWMDARGARHARELAAGRLRVAGYDPRKLARWVRRTGGAPALSGRDPLGHILWLRAERPEVYSAAARFLEPVDWLGFKLSGRLATTGVTATLHWVTDARDPWRVRYDDELLRLAGLRRDQLPELLQANAVLGPLTDAARSELGLGRAVPVVAGTPDTMSAAVGSGAVADHAAHLYVGTSAWLSCHVPYKRTDVLRSVASLPSALPGRWLVSCEQETAGASVELLRDVLLPGSGADGFEELERLAALAPAGSGGVLFTPWLNGERTPVDDHVVRGGLHNLTLATTREDVVRAVLEGVALNVRWMQQAVERFCRRRLDPVAFVGGGARSPLWAQILADVLGRTVHRVADPGSANLRGAALLALLGLGELRAGDLHGRAPLAAVHRPREATRVTYDDLFAAFRGSYRAGRRVSRRLATVRERKEATR
jgi:xylulokinase